MNIRQLYIFKTVCKHVSFTKAAKELYMSQPAISHAISDLEKELGCTLLDRLNHKIYINEMGQRFLNKATQILELYDDLEHHFIHQNKDIAITIGSSITIATYILPKMIAEFQNAYPEVTIQVHVDSARNIEHKLLDNAIDLAFIEGIPKSSSLVSIPFSTFDIAIVAHPSHPLSKQKRISVSSLLKEKILLREKGSAIRNCFDSALLLQNKAITPTWTSVNSQVLLQATKENLGISVLPYVLVEQDIKNGTLKKLTIDTLSLTNTNHVVYHKDKSLHNNATSFLEYVLTTMNT